VVRWYSVWVLASVKELVLGATRDLLRMGVDNAVLVSWKRGDIMGKLVACGRRSRNGGLAGFDQASSNSAGDFLHVFRRACVM
jgi:hypothetical protein